MRNTPRPLRPPRNFNISENGNRRIDNRCARKFAVGIPPARNGHGTYSLAFFKRDRDNESNTRAAGISIQPPVSLQHFSERDFERRILPHSIREIKSSIRIKAEVVEKNIGGDRAPFNG